MPRMSGNKSPGMTTSEAVILHPSRFCGSQVLASRADWRKEALPTLGPPMFRFFETLIDPFRAHDPRMPPPTLAGFYWHYVREVWPVLAALMGIGLVISLIEVS